MHDHTRGASTGSQHGYELHAGFISNPRGNPQRVSINDQSERGRAQKQWRLTSSTAVHWSRPWRSRGLRQYLNPPNRAQRCSSSGICPEQAFDLLISSAYLHGRGTHRVVPDPFACLDPLCIIWRPHGEEIIQAAAMDQGRRSRAQGERATEDSSSQDCARAQENGGRNQAEGFQPGDFPRLAFLEQDGLSSPHHPALSVCLRISFSRKPVYLAVKREGRLLRDMLYAGRPAVRTAALSASWYPLSGADWGSSGLLSCSRPSLRCWWRDRRCARCSWHKT